MSRAGDHRTREQVNAALNGCDHVEVRRDGGFWACVACAQWFGPIFLETPRRNGDPTIKEAMKQ